MISYARLTPTGAWFTLDRPSTPGVAMRFPVIGAAAAALALTTCTPADRGTAVAPGAPQFAHVQDLDGTPDMIVDAKTLATSWVVYDQELKENFCSIEEANLAPGKY